MSEAPHCHRCAHPQPRQEPPRLWVRVWDELDGTVYRFCSWICVQDFAAIERGKRTVVEVGA